MLDNPWVVRKVISCVNVIYTVISCGVDVSKVSFGVW